MQNAEKVENINNFLKFMENNGFNEQAQDVNNFLLYIVGLQVQVNAMTKELQEVKEQLNRINNVQPDIVGKKDIKMIVKIQKKFIDFSEQLGKVKNNFIDSVKRTVDKCKDHGKNTINSQFQKVTLSMKSMLMWCKDKR